MTDQYLGEIRMFAGTYAPSGWALCNGQLIAISQNTALFSLLGTYYGGDGRVTFALPNLQGASPMGAGSGAGLTPRVIGESGGEPTVALIQTQMAAHNHALQGLDDAGTSASPAGAVPAEIRGYLYTASNSNASMNPSSLSPAGGGQPHNNMPPYLAVNFIIALQGIYPPRS